MDCHVNHHYHPYSPPGESRQERYIGREWQRRNHNPPYAAGHRGGRNRRYLSGRRGTGNASQAINREDLYHSHPSHRQLRSSAGHIDPRYDEPHQISSPPWYQGRSLHYGPPRPPTHYYYQRNIRLHYREAGYGPPGLLRMHPKSTRPTSTHPTGSSFPNVKSSSSNTPSRSPHFTKNSVTKVSGSSCSSQTSASVTCKHVHPNSAGTTEQPTGDKQTTSDIKNPSVVKVAPFSHQPSPNFTTSSVTLSLSSGTTNNSSIETDSQFKPEGEIVLNLPSKITGSQESTERHTCPAPDCGLKPVFFLAADGQMQSFCKIICSCELRKRSLKYVDKGKTKDDSIVVDSDEEDEKKNNVVVDSVNKQVIDAEKLSEGNSPVKDQSSINDESSCQESPRKRAKMSTETVSVTSSFLEDQSAPVLASEASNTITESVADTVSRVMDGLRQSLGEGCSSSTSSDSLSLVVSPHIADEGTILGNPQILRGIMSVCKETSNPARKFKTSPRNLYTAAKDCNLQKVLSLLVEGCDPNQQLLQAKGKTAMHAAAAGGYVDIMACLRLAGCDLNLVDYENRTPLFDAVNNHKVKAVEYLIDCGAVLGTKDTGGMTCFHLAARHGHTDLIKLLFKTGKFDIDQKDDGGWTPIMWAAEDKQYDATQLLIEQGANVHVRDEELNVGLHWAAYSGNFQVCKLLLDKHTDINSQNIRQDTPLHVAARTDRYECVQLFVGRGANIHITNKDGQTPVQVAESDSRVEHLLKSKLELELCQESIRPRILHSDISRGQENVSISCINEVDDEPFPEFTFAKECCEIYNGTINWSVSKFEGCQCLEDCRSGTACSCAKRSQGRSIWYNEDGVLMGDMQKYNRPLLFECNRMCQCWSYCSNRVVQRGMRYPLQLYKTYRKGNRVQDFMTELVDSGQVVISHIHGLGMDCTFEYEIQCYGWGVRSLAEIPKGSFICEYTGELISDTEADARDDDSYLFDLDCEESAHELYCIDAKNYGNISRFINHSCEPNILPIRVFINHRDMRFPRIAFFATKEIKVHQEICFNYGDRFWSVKKKEFYCECRTPSCKYRNPHS